jgi:biopolymer transport protein TolQ
MAARRGIEQHGMRERKDLVMAVRSLQVEFDARALDDVLEARLWLDRRRGASFELGRNSGARAVSAACRGESRLPARPASGRGLAALAGRRIDRNARNQQPETPRDDRPAVLLAAARSARCRRARAAAAAPAASPQLRAAGAACELAGADGDDPVAGRLGDELVRDLPQDGVFSRATREADEFEARFWSGSEITALYRAATDRNRLVTGMEAIFEAGYREYARLRQQHKAIDARSQLESAQRAMRATLAREVDRLEHNLELLAQRRLDRALRRPGRHRVRHHDFLPRPGQQQAGDHRLGRARHLEALIATAMGLFAAIPAVWAYNRFATRVERLSVRYESFAEEFSSILQRQSHVDEP